MSFNDVSCEQPHSRVILIVFFVIDDATITELCSFYMSRILTKCVIEMQLMT